MKYYAVTDDPTELLHYGVKGMKWGEHLFGDDLKPKSPAYKKAVTKLKGFVSKAAKAVKVPAAKKTAVQKSTEKRAKQQAKFNNAVKAAQNRIKVVENLSNLDKMYAQEKKSDRMDRAYNHKMKFEYKNEIRAAKDADKQARVDARRERRYAKNERKMEKYLQQARQGKLKYGKLSDDQVREIKNRLGIERDARVLGSAEKTWRQQKRDALRQGTLQGITRGTAAAMEEVARAGVQYGIRNLRNRKIMDAKNKLDAQRQHDANRIRNKKTRGEIKEDIKQEYIEAKIRNDNEDLQKLLDKEHERLRLRESSDRQRNRNDEEWQNFLDETGLTEKEARKQYLHKKRGLPEEGTEKSREEHRKILDKHNREEYDDYLDKERQKAADEINEINEKREEREQKRIEEAKRHNKEEDDRFLRETLEFGRQQSVYDHYQKLLKESPDEAAELYPDPPAKPVKPKPPQYQSTELSTHRVTNPYAVNPYLSTSSVPPSAMSYPEWLREKRRNSQNGGNKNKNNNNNKNKNNGGGGNR